MIEFSADNGVVVMRVDTGARVDLPAWRVTYSLDNQAAAAMCAKALNDRLHRLVEGARRKAYEQGYCAGRNHRARRHHFSGCLTS